jgi:hypothetical protein
MVREVVYPFYIETVEKSTIDYTIEVYDNQRRKTAEEILEEILIKLKLIQNF